MNGGFYYQQVRNISKKSGKNRALRMLFLCLLLGTGLPSTAQIINNFAGTGVCCGFGPENGPATTAVFTSIGGLAVDDTGNIYISDASTVRKVNKSGFIYTIAGTTGSLGTVAGYSGDNGPATAAKMQVGVSDIAFDNIGNIYICDSGNNVIRKVNAAGIITTFAGTGVAGFFGDGAAATAAQFDGPCGIAVDRAGNVFVADYNNRRVRIIKTTGVISTYAGTGVAGYSGDGGAATSAKFAHPSHLAYDNAGNLYITDNGNIVVRKVNTTGVISTYAGTGVSGYTGDGGTAIAARLNSPGGLAFDAANNLYIGDGDVVRRVSAAGVIHTVSGDGVSGYTGDGTLATASKINTSFVAVDDSGNLFLNQVSQAIRFVKGVGAIDNAPAFNLGPTQSYSVCINSSANSINSLFPVRDLDAGQTETWRVYSGPAHGALGGFPYSAVSTGGVFSPTGLTYTPTLGYSGPDEFTIQVYDGYSVDTTHISITVLPLSTVGAISGLTNICTGSVALFSDAAVSGAWTSSNSSIATVGSSTGIVTGIAAGTALISYTINACGVASTSVPVVIANGVAINPVTGTTTICAGITTPLNDLTAAGTWESSNTAVASIGSSSGSMTGVGAGTSVIIYTTFQGCGAATATASVTVNTTPATGVIYGITTICAGTITTLGETVSGGTWSSSNSGVVSIGSASGAATGVTVGSAIVSYALSNTCGTAYATSFVYVNTVTTVSAISGSSSVCSGSSAILTDPTPGGTWSSSNVAIATVGSSSGILNGISAGTMVVTYSVVNSCGTAIVTLPVTVGSIGALGAITGTTTFCQGLGATLSDVTTGGTWSSSNTAVATIGSSSGTVVGVSPGTATVIYTATVTCGVATTSTTVTVNPLPNAGSISGISNLCSGSFSTFTDVSAGGTWATSNGAVATVGSTSGTVTGISSGTVIITYSVTNSCGTAMTTTTINVGAAAPIGAITGTTTICPGERVTLSDTTLGGTWSSANSGIATAGSDGAVTGVGTGSVQIIYTAMLSCGIATATATVTVNAAPTLISTLTPPSVCSGSLFSYVPASSYGGATFSWSRPTTAGISNPSATGLGDIAESLDNTTFYNISVTYNYTIMALGCTAHKNITVTVLPIPRLSSASADTICSGGTFNYTPTSLTSGVTYTWSRSAVAGISPATSTGTDGISESLINGTSSSLTAVYLYALSANGCTSSRTVSLLVTPQPVVTSITTKSPSSVCDNTLFQNFGASSVPGSGVTYTWSAINGEVWDIGSTSQYCLVNFTTPGTALVILSASVGSAHCIINDTVSVNVSSSVSSSIPQVVFFDEQFAYLDNNEDSYQWGFDNAATLDSTLIPGATFQTYPNSNPDFTNNYYWVMTAYNGCMQKTYYNLPLAVKNVNANSTSLKVYPDPAGSSVNVDLQYQGGKTEVEIMNMLGQKVRSQSVPGNSVTFDVADLPAGCYIINCLQHGTKIGNARFIKN